MRRSHGTKKLESMRDLLRNTMETVLDVTKVRGAVGMKNCVRRRRPQHSNASRKNSFCKSMRILQSRCSHVKIALNKLAAKQRMPLRAKQLLMLSRANLSSSVAALNAELQCDRHTVRRSVAQLANFHYAISDRILKDLISWAKSKPLLKLSAAGSMHDETTHTIHLNLQNSSIKSASMLAICDESLSGHKRKR